MISSLKDVFDKSAVPIIFLNSIIPKEMPIIPVMRILINIAPLTFLAKSVIRMINPAKERRDGAEPSAPRVTKVLGSETTKPADFSPINAIKSPMPAAEASFNDRGIELTINSLILDADKRVNITPEAKTIPSAVCQGTPIFPQTTKLKKAFNPIPGAKAIG